MLNGVINNVHAYIASAVAACFLMISCGGSNPNAKSLFDQAANLYGNGDYQLAIQYLDSLKNNYPSEIEIQHRAMYLRTLVDEQVIAKQIAINDSALAQSEADIANMKGKFAFVKDKDMVEGYIVAKSAQKNPLMNRTGLEARIDERANIYLVSLLNGRKANHDRVEVRSGMEFAGTETVPYNDATNYRFRVDGASNEMVTFRGGKTDTICMFVAQHPSAKLIADYIGSTKVSIPLSKADARAIGDTYIYAKALQNNREFNAKKKYLDAKMQITREQQVKTEQYR